MFVVSVDAEKCNGCGECAENCPIGILELVDGKAEVVGDDCMGCESCVEVCSTGAVSVEEY